MDLNLDDNAYFVDTEKPEDLPFHPDELSMKLAREMIEKDPNSKKTKKSSVHRHFHVAARTLHVSDLGIFVGFGARCDMKRSNKKSI